MEAAVTVPEEHPIGPTAGTAPLYPVDTEKPVRIENAGFRSVREIIIVSTMSPFFIALLALVASTFRTRAAQQAEIVALRHQIAVLQQSAPVVSDFGKRTGCFGFGCPVSGRTGGAGCVS